MSVSSTSSAGGPSPWQILAQLKAARAGASSTTGQAQQAGSDPLSGVTSAASKLATDLGSFASQLTGGTSQPTNSTASTTDANTAGTASSTDAAAKLSSDLQSFLTQLQSVAGNQAQGPQGTKPHHHHHHDDPSAENASASSADAGQATTDASASTSGLGPSFAQASAEFAQRITRAFESYAAQTSGTANSNSASSSLGSISA